MAYLSSARRGQIIFGALASYFKVRSSNDQGNPSLEVGEAEVFSAEKPDIKVLKAQLIWLRNYADLRVDRIPEINVQTGDILSFFGALAQLNSSRRKNTLELLEIVQSLCVQLEMQLKHYCWSPRPIDFSDQVQPVIQTPDHSTFPSGHSTEAFALATVLYRLESQKPVSVGLSSNSNAMPFRIAHRIAVNRTIAGVHFPVDSAAGALLGCVIGEAVYAIANQKPAIVAHYGSGGENLRASDDFTQEWLRQAFKQIETEKTFAKHNLVEKFWQAAAAEWNSVEGGE